MKLKEWTVGGDARTCGAVEREIADLLIEIESFDRIAQQCRGAYRVLVGLAQRRVVDSAEQQDVFSRCWLDVGGVRP